MPLSEQRHHRRSIDRIWPPALEMKLAQWSRDDALDSNDGDDDDDTKDANHHTHTQHFRGHWTPDGRSSIRPKSHIIPPAPPLERQNSGQRMSNHDSPITICINESESNHSRSGRRLRRTSSAGQLSDFTGTEYPKRNITIQYKRQCKTPTPIYDGNNNNNNTSTPHSPYTFTVLRPLEPLVPLTEKQQLSNTGYKITTIEYTPDSNSELSTPPSNPWSFHFSSSNSSPAVSRRPSFMMEPSPEVLDMLETFLKQHSNGHIMYPRPTNCTETCSDSSHSSSSSACLGSSDNNQFNNSSNDDVDIPDIDDDELFLSTTISSVTVLSDRDMVDNDFDEDHLDHDERMLMLGQSPDPSEFDPDEVFMTENQKNAGKYVADSPIFFNGFPLLRMTPVRE
ncbi:hypothetical protein BGX27_006550 [Mortierella sp. AM989]|nr:hypothetical protein BGX27_006550 [Mortierella sp. AM989]